MDKISILGNQSVTTKYDNYFNQNTVNTSRTKSNSTEDVYIKTNETLVPDVYTDKKVDTTQQNKSLVREDDYEYYCLRVVKENGEKIYFPPKNAPDEEKLAWINTCKKLQGESDEAFSFFTLGVTTVWEMENGVFSQNSTSEILEDYLNKSISNLTQGGEAFGKEAFESFLENTKRNIDVLTDLINELKAIKTK